MNDHIRLSFPVNAAYVSSARLTASSIANRIRFDIDEIEDIKTAVSEACTYIIKRLAHKANGNFEICFIPGKDEISVDIAAQDVESAGDLDGQEMSLMMIKALVDEFAISKLDGKISIAMLKKHKGSLV